MFLIFCSSQLQRLVTQPLNSQTVESGSSPFPHSVSIQAARKNGCQAMYTFEHFCTNLQLWDVVLSLLLEWTSRLPNFSHVSIFPPLYKEIAYRIPISAVNLLSFTCKI